LGGLKLEEATVKTTFAHLGVPTSAHSGAITIPVLGGWTITSAHTGILRLLQGFLPDTSSITFTDFPLKGLLTWLLDFHLDSTVIQPSSGVTLGPIG
jgi:hypothetical protein